MSAGVERKAAEPWTVADQLMVRSTFREHWEEDFATNYVAVADKISESITQEIFHKIREALSDAYKPLPSSSKPLKFEYSLALKYNPTDIEQWGQEASELPPFREWFDAFKAGERKRKDRDRPSIHEEPEAISSSIRLQDKDLEVSYFQDLMSQIGHRVEANVAKNLQTFAEQPKNPGFQYKVEWYRKAEKLLANPSDFRDNYVSVSSWIVDSDNTNPTNAPAKKSNTYRCSKRLSNCILM